MVGVRGLFGARGLFGVLLPGLLGVPLLLFGEPGGISSVLGPVPGALLAGGPTPSLHCFAKTAHTDARRRSALGSSFLPNCFFA